MSESFTNLIALITLVLWPAIPLFWLPVHCFPRFFRQLGFLTYILPFITWLPVALLTYRMENLLLSSRIALPTTVNGIGIVLFLAGAGLQIWTLLILSPRGIIGMPEVTTVVPGKLMTRGPFSIQRHPTYLSHTLMLLGLFLWTEVTTLGIVMIVDALVVNGAVIPLEERELRERFGKEYEEYSKRVPGKFLPLPRPR